MTRSNVFAVLGVLALAACAEPPLTPVPTLSTGSFGSRANSVEDVPELTGQSLADINAALALAGANVRVAKAEFILEVNGYNEATSQIVFANDRTRGIGARWVNRDPRRGDRVGVTYAFGSDRATNPTFRNPDGSQRQLTLAEQAVFIDEGMSAWRNLTCSNAPIMKVEIPVGTDPDQLDEFFRGLPPSANYAPPADIVQSSWQPIQFFLSIGRVFGLPPQVAANILGITFTFVFEDAEGPTDIDGDGNLDIGLVEMFYNAAFPWGSAGAGNAIDLFSIIAHESGHAMGLGHFGKIFVTKKDASDNVVTLDEIKFAPEALMNAIYFTGRSEIRGTDKSSFCQLWASAN